MAQGAFTPYDTALLKFFNGSFDFEGDTLTAVLLGSGYSPDAAHGTYADISGSEIADSDYSPASVGGASVSLDSGTVSIDCADVSFGDPVSLEAKYFALVRQSGGSLAGTDDLIGYVDLNNDSGTATVASTNSNFDVAPNAAGLFTASVA